MFINLLCVLPSTFFTIKIEKISNVCMYFFYFISFLIFHSREFKHSTFFLLVYLVFVSLYAKQLLWLKECTIFRFIYCLNVIIVCLPYGVFSFVYQNYTYNNIIIIIIMCKLVHVLYYFSYFFIESVMVICVDLCV